MKVRYWVVPGLALLIAIFTLIPAEVWAHPTVDQEYKGFDRNLEYVSAGGAGSVDVTSSTADIKGAAQATPTITLLTTPLRRILVSMNASIVRAEGAAEPLRIGIWSPLNSTGYFVVFGPAPSNAITIVTISGGTSGTSLTGGEIGKQVPVGAYTLGNSYGIKLLVDRDRGVISFQVFANGGMIGQDSVTSHDFPTIFVPVRLSLTASSADGIGSSDVLLSSYDVTLLHERFWTSKVADAKAEIILLGLAVVALLLIAAAAAQHRSRISALLKQIRSVPSRLGSAVAGRHRALALVVGAIALYLAGNAFLFQLGGHPFDMGGEKVFAYVGSTYGPTQLYYLPNLVSLAPAWQGTPYIEAGFPYGPIFAYLFAAVGWVYKVVFAGAASSSYSGLPLEAAIKSVNVLFGLGDAALIYLILRRIAVPQRWRLIATGLFLFNPAVWFSMSVWGQTHVISVFFVLAAIWLAESGLVMWAWLALIAACLTRPQMLVFALFIGIVFLRKFAWRRNLFALSWAVVLTYLILLPLMLASSPSLPVDLVVNNFHVQEAGGNDPSVTTVSQGAYSVWPLMTYLTHGASGLQRIYTQSANSLVGPLSYQRASQILTFVAILVVIAGLLRRSRDSFDAGRYIPMVALGGAAFLMLLTGIVSTHFILVLPLLVLSWRWTGGVAYLFIVLAWSITTVVTMYGDMGLLLSSQDYPLLAQSNNAITHFFVWVYTSDRFINVGTVANVCAVSWLAWLTFRPLPVVEPTLPTRAVTA